ncbi:hypothetical protein F4009_00375 [Candidatus Poribacteria bacterium]|nr:hypothetical protein [Candidatus Poribacteria bacterium]MYH80674.1 hypothetical protein [Candidatus Poribacteria bacterium]MYK92456.1 hypothetical protein [Candidatus Poribacteria bacterium]
MKKWIPLPLLVIFIFVGIYLLTTTQHPQNAIHRLVQQPTQAGTTFDFRKNATLTDNTAAISEDPWDVWVEKQTDAALQSALKSLAKELPDAQQQFESKIASLREKFRAALVKRAEELKAEHSSPPPVESNLEVTVRHNSPPKYEGPQTTEALLDEYAENYNRKWESSEIAEKYPQDEWIQMLLDRGIIIEDHRDFFWYQEARRELIRLEKDPATWASGRFGIPPIEDWETYKTAYIERNLWANGLRLDAMKADPACSGGIFVGKNQDVFLPTRPGRIYVERNGTRAKFYGGILNEIQQFDLLFKGISPENYEIIYINSEGSILSERPPLITRQEVKNTGGIPPPEEWFHGDVNPEMPADFEMDTVTQENRDYRKLDVPNLGAEARQNAEKEVQHAQQNAEKVLEHLTKSGADLAAELEKQLLPDLPTEADFEKALRERFAPERFNRALSTLNQYGPEEGLRRLKKSDPEVANQIEKQLQR